MVLLAFFSFAIGLTAQGQVPLWLGKMQQVKLFKDKRPDIVRILGEPEDDGNTGGDAAYYFDWGHMFVLSVDEVCSQQNEKYPGDVPENKDRVGELRLVIDADQKVMPSDLGLNAAGSEVFDTVNNLTKSTTKIYVNHAAGRSYEVRSDGTVDMIAYIPSREDISRTCK